MDWESKELVGSFSIVCTECDYKTSSLKDLMKHHKEMKHKGYFFPNPDSKTTAGKLKQHEESIIEDKRGRCPTLCPSPLDLGVRLKRDRPPGR